MKLTHVELDRFTFKILDSVSTDSYVVSKIDGLGPTDPGVSISKVLNQQATLQNKTPKLRQLVFELKLQPKWNIGEDYETLRNDLYELLNTPNNRANLLILHNKLGEHSRITGYISKFESDLFAKDPMVQLTMECVEANFFENQYTTMPTYAIPNMLVTNAGTAPTWISFRATFSQAVLSGFAVSDGYGNKMRFRQGFQAGDILTVDTTPGQRGAYYTRGGTRYDMLNALTSDSTWFPLFVGTTEIYVSTPYFAWDYFRYVKRYVGV